MSTADLITDARRWPRPYTSPMYLIGSLTDALEAAIKERDDAVREMHARELHHFEEEQKSARAQACIDNPVSNEGAG